ncbi:MAG: hypothetical protein AAF988_04185 [Pseudomonadota bacterium]
MSDQNDNFELDDELDDDAFADEDFDDLGLDDFDLDDDGFTEDDLGGMEDNPVEKPQHKQSAKKSFSLDFNTMVIIGGVVLGAIVLFFQMTGSKSIPNQQQRFVSSLGIEAATESIEKEVESKTVEDQGFLNSPDEQSEPSAVETASEDLPMPTPVAQMTEDTALSNIPSVADTLEFSFDDEFIEEPQQNVPEQNDSDAYEVSEMPAEAEVIENAPVILEQPQNQIPINNEALDAIGDKLDVFVSRFHELESSILTLETKLSEQNTAMENKISSLQTKISKAEKQIQNAKIARSQPSSQSKPQAKTTKKQAPRIIWELKAAQPGKAWIAQKGSNEIKAVQVGDNLAGLGRVQSIENQAGQWVVRGSTQTIRQ